MAEEGAPEPTAVEEQNAPAPVVKKEPATVVELSNVNITPVQSEAAGAVAPTDYSYKAKDPPLGQWRGSLCECCGKCWCCPMCLVAFMFPQAIMAQAWYHVMDNKKEALKGFYAILIGFTILEFFTGIVSTASKSNAGGGFSLGMMVALILLLTIAGRVRRKYGIVGNFCQNNAHCATCNDGCCDCAKGFFCAPCFVMQIGHHIFNYEVSTEATVELPDEEQGLVGADEE